ncbi:MAG: glycosyltransferase [Lysobacterales bacterium]
MKVLHVVPSYLPATRYGGPIVSVHQLCAALVRAGHQVDVATTNVDGAGDSAVALGVRVDLDGVGVYYFPSRRLRRLYWSPPMKAWLRRHAGDYDVVHLHSVFLWPTLIAARAAEASGVPFVLSPRGMLVRELVRARSRWLKTAWIALFERRSLAAAAAVHLTSKVELAAFEDYVFRTRARLAVIPNGVEDPASLDTDSPKRPAYVLMLGRISWKKRIEIAIAALADLPELHLVIAGGDDEGLLPRLRRLAQERGVAARVNFVGPVHGQAKQALLREALALVMVSHTENYGNVVLEALAQATPAIVVAQVGAADAVRAAGAGWVIDDSSQALVECLRELIADPAAAAECGRRGAGYVRRELGWDTIAARMAALYAEVTDGVRDAV